MANGTAEAPIVITSAEEDPVAGSWGGVEWFSGPATGNAMSHVRIEYAGADSGNSGFGCGPDDSDAALLLGWAPADAFIQDCTFSDSAAGGIVCGWNSDAAGPNFVDGNTFVDIPSGFCEVSEHSAANGTCPNTPPACQQ
jgi:hypothetical protein